MKQYSPMAPLLVLPTILILVGIVAVSIGTVAISPAVVGRMLLRQLPIVDKLIAVDWSNAHQIIVMQVRAPRVILAMLVGGGLSVSGVIFQGLLRNPLADPYIIGVSAGASLGAAIALLFIIPLGWASLSVLPPAAFIGALFAAYVVYKIGSSHGKIEALRLLLAGVAVAAFLTAIMSFLIVLRIQNLQEVYLWLIGSLSGRSWQHVQIAAPYTVAGVIVTYFFAKDFNVLLLGEETAHSLGIEVQRLQRIALVVGSLLAAAAVSVSGVIGFVGLMVPHGVRMVFGPDHRKLIPLAFFCGAIYLVVADTVARTIFSPIELPVGVITALAGGPFFLYLLRRP